MNGCFRDPFSEAYVMAAQEMALFTKYHKRNILHVSNDATYRVCKKDACDETIYHILAGCDSLAKKEYSTRHDAMCKYLHFEISKAYNLSCGKKTGICKNQRTLLWTRMLIISMTKCCKPTLR